MTSSEVNSDEFFELVLPFFDEIGIPYQLESYTFDSFLPGVGLSEGILWIDRSALVHPGDILHEAGHYAVTEAANRSQLGQHTLENNDDLNGEEMAAMLWSYVTALHLGINPRMVFHKQGYKGQSNWILETYTAEDYFGLPVLRYFGMAHYEGEGPEFPKMKAWIRP